MLSHQASPFLFSGAAAGGSHLSPAFDKAAFHAPHATLENPPPAFPFQPHMAHASSATRLGGYKRRADELQMGDVHVSGTESRPKNMRVSSWCGDSSPVPSPFEGFGSSMHSAVPSESTGSSTRLGGFKRQRDASDSPHLFPGSPSGSPDAAAAAAEGGPGHATPQRGHGMAPLHLAKRRASLLPPPPPSAEAGAIVPSRRGLTADRRTSSHGGRVVLWLDTHGRVSAVVPAAGHTSGTFKGKLHPILRIPALDLSSTLALDLPTLLERQQLVPRHTASTFLRRAAQWLADRFVWNVPEMYDPVQPEDWRGGGGLGLGAGPRIEILEEDPRPQQRGVGGLFTEGEGEEGSAGSEEGDAFLPDVELRPATPQSPVFLAPHQAPAPAADGVAQFTGLQFTQPRRAAAPVPVAVAPRSGTPYPGDDDDVVLGVEVNSADLPTLANHLAQQFNLARTAAPTAPATHTAHSVAGQRGLFATRDRATVAPGRMGPGTPPSGHFAAAHAPAHTGPGMPASFTNTGGVQSGAVLLPTPTAHSSGVASAPLAAQPLQAGAFNVSGVSQLPGATAAAPTPGLVVDDDEDDL